MSWRARVFDPIISMEAASRTDELDSGIRAGLRKVGILGKKSVSRMDGVRPHSVRDIKDLVDVQVRLRRCCRPEW